MKSVLVRIPVANTWPSPQEVAARNLATKALSESGIGVCTGAGGGMGEMDFSYRVADEAVARSEIVRIMQQFFPGVQDRLSLSD